MPAPCGVPLSVSCFSPLSRTPARNHSPMSCKMRGSAILCATIRNSHSWSTESKGVAVGALILAILGDRSCTAFTQPRLRFWLLL
jgi:hypothetical protein